MAISSTPIAGAPIGGGPPAAPAPPAQQEGRSRGAVGSEAIGGEAIGGHYTPLIGPALPNIRQEIIAKYDLTEPIKQEYIGVQRFYIRREYVGRFAITVQEGIREEFVGDYRAFVRTEVDSVYSLNVIPRQEVESDYAIENFDRVSQEIVGDARLPVANEILATYSLLGPVQQEHESSYDLEQYIQVRQEYAGVYPISVATEVSGPYALLSSVRQEVGGFFSYTGNVKNEYVCNYEMYPLNPVRNEYRCIYSYESVTQIGFTGVPLVIFDGRELDIISADIAADEGGYAWTCRVALSDVQEYALFKQDDPFIIRIYGEDYHFIVDSKSLNRADPANITMTLNGISPSAMYDLPRADEYTNDWEDDRTAKLIAEDALGHTISQWDLVDWTIPGYRYSVEGVSPLSVVQTLVEAAGGIVESDIDGTLVVRHEYPVSIPNYATTPPDQQYDEVNDVVQVTENFVAGKIYNRIRILDIEPSYADSIIFEANKDYSYKGVLKAYPGPWREHVNVRHTAPGGVIILSARSPIVVEEIIYGEPQADGSNGPGELIEFFEGSGTVSLPIWNIENVTWLSVNLGGLAFEPGSNTFTTTDPTKQYGLAYITYKTKYFLYDVESINGDSVQFLMEDTTEDI